MMLFDTISWIPRQSPNNMVHSAGLARRELLLVNESVKFVFHIHMIPVFYE